jgi:YD repeat-containing protein
VTNYSPDGQTVERRHGDRLLRRRYNGYLATSAEDALGHTAAYGYDARGRIATFTNALADVWRFEHTGSAQLGAVVLPRGGRFTFAFDDEDNLVRITMPGGRVTTRQFEAGARLAAVTFADGSTRTHRYDPQGRLVQTQHPETTVAIDYRPATDTPTAMHQDIPGRPRHTMSFGFNGPLVTSVTVRDGSVERTFTYTLNALKEIVAVEDGGLSLPLTRGADGLTTAVGGYTVTRDGPMRAPTAWNQANTRIEQRFDNLGRLTGRSVVVDNVVRGRFDLSFDAGSRVATQTVQIGAETRALT